MYVSIKCTFNMQFNVMEHFLSGHGKCYRLSTIRTCITMVLYVLYVSSKVYDHLVSLSTWKYGDYLQWVWLSGHSIAILEYTV